MTLSYQFGDVEAHGPTIRAQARQDFITQLGRNFQVIYEQANGHGQKLQTAGSNMASTDSAVGPGWA